MAQWVHCNTCMAEPPNGLKFYLSSCFHIFCDNCVGQGFASPTCKLCGNNTTVNEINSSYVTLLQLDADKQLFFLTPQKLRSRQEKELMTVAAFQERQIAFIHKCKTEQMKKGSKMINAWKQDMKKKTEYQKQNDQIKEEIRRLLEQTKAMQEYIHRNNSRSPGARRSPGQALQRNSPFKSPGQIYRKSPGNSTMQRQPAAPMNVFGQMQPMGSNRNLFTHEDTSSFAYGSPMRVTSSSPSVITTPNLLGEQNAAAQQLNSHWQHSPASSGSKTPNHGGVFGHKTTPKNKLPPFMPRSAGP